MDIDDLSLESLADEMTIGAALIALRACMDLSHKGLSEGCAVTRDWERKWSKETAAALSSVFNNKANAMLFLASQPDNLAHAAMPLTSLEHRSRALFAIHKELEEQRERISVAVYELMRKVAEHQELIVYLEAQTQMTGDMWQKLVGDPLVAPPIKRLRGLGVVQSAVYDLLKFGVVAAGTGMVG